MKKLLITLPSAAAALVVLALSLWGVGSLAWRPAQRAGPLELGAVAAGDGDLLAGVAVVPLEPTAPAPVAGFPRRDWAERGPRDPLAARALVLSEPGCAVALVSVELLVVTEALQEAIERRVAPLGLDRVVVAATHTHAGPGGFWHDAVAERFATGPYDPATFEHVVARAAAAVEQAAAARTPASLAVARGRDAALAWNRGAEGGEVDGRLALLRLTDRAGARVAEAVLYPAHATLLGPDNRRLSGDWPGALMRSRGAPALLFQGALGDQAPATPDAAGDRPQAYARQVSADLDRLELGAPDPRPPLAVATATAVLPPPDPGAAPPALRRIARNLAYDRFPDRARVSAIRLGPLTLLTVPGEPVADLGGRWRALAGDGAEVLSLAAGYVGYVETRERMAARRGETARTYYGPALADRLGEAVQRVAEAVAIAAPTHIPTAHR